MSIYAVKAGSLAIKATSNDREFVASWSKKTGLMHLGNWEVRWEHYDPTAGKWIKESSSTTSYRQSTYTLDDTQTKVRVRVRGVSTEKANGKSWWTSLWRSKAKAVGAADDEDDGEEIEEPTAPSVSAVWSSAGYAIVSRGSDITSDDWDTATWQAARWDDGSEGGEEPASVGYDTITGTLSSGTISTNIAIPEGSYAVFAGKTTVSDGAVSETAWDDGYTDAIYGVPSALESLEFAGSYDADSGVQAIEFSWTYGGAVEGTTASDVTVEMRWAASEAALETSYDSAESAVGDGSYVASFDDDDVSVLYAKARVVVDDSDGRASDWTVAGPIALGSTPTAPTLGGAPAYAEVGGDIELSWTHNCADGCGQGGWWLQESLNDGSVESVYAVVASGYVSSITTDDWDLRIGSVVTGASAGSKVQWYVMGVYKLFSAPCDLTTGMVLVYCEDIIYVYSAGWTYEDNTLSLEELINSDDLLGSVMVTSTQQTKQTYTITTWTDAASSPVASAASAVTYPTPSDAQTGDLLYLRLCTAPSTGWASDGEDDQEWAYWPSIEMVSPMSLTAGAEDVAALPAVVYLSAAVDVRRWDVRLAIGGDEAVSTVGADGDDVLLAPGAPVWSTSVEPGDDAYGARSVALEVDTSECTLLDGATYAVTASAVSVYGTTGTAGCEFACAFDGSAPEPDLRVEEDADALAAHLFPVAFSVLDTGVDGLEVTVAGCSDGALDIEVESTADGTDMLAAATVTSDGCDITSASILADGVETELDTASETAAALVSQALAALSCGTADAPDLDALWALAIDESTTLAVYRTDPDGRQVEIASGLANTGTVEVIDARAALNGCTYRVRATSAAGCYGFADADCDLECDEVVIDFDDGRNSYGAGETEDAEADESATTERVRVAWNLSLSESYDPDVELVEYVGNREPTRYAGTQRGSTASASGVVLDVDDDDVVPALRRFAGDVVPAYYRDPTGLGYWADVAVSMSRSADSRAVDISLEVTRVDGDYSGTVYPEGA